MQPKQLGKVHSPTLQAQLLAIDPPRGSRALLLPTQGEDRADGRGGNGVRVTADTVPAADAVADRPLTRKLSLLLPPALGAIEKRSFIVGRKHRPRSSSEPGDLRPLPGIPPANHHGERYR